MSTTNFATPQRQKPNPHPYAIKTTSTALLSRNSSSSSIPSTNHHYIPPSSPSPSPTQTTGFGGEKRNTRHRYSRSLTSELPRPLPALPSSAAAVLEDDDTPRRRVQRAYSLPQELELPEDPKRWTPAEVSMYLTSSLNAGGGHDLPTPVAHDLATFVRDKKITGKSFLRLNEVDLEEYGINQLWRTTLVNASRALRRNVLHGRIWGNHAEHDNEDEDDDDYNNLSSLSTNSNPVSTNRKRSLSTTSETRGRVRDMIDTLERSSSTSSSELDEEMDGRRNNDTNSKRHHHHHKHHSMEQGRLPQRGSVSNLFGTSGPGPDTSEREIEDKDNTITAQARRNVNGNEPRLLPFPPTGVSNLNHHSHGYTHILTPSHTGTSCPLPPSPDHARLTPYSNHVLNNQPLQQQQQQPYLFPSHPHPHPQPNHTPTTFDYYELGFKNAIPISSSSPSPPLAGPPIRSPNSQRYIVQHNPPHINVQPSTATPGGNPSTTTTSGSKGSRLLPYPPIVGEAELFHPRPRMGLGVGGLAGGLEDGLDESADKGGGGGDESAYQTALETQTESVDSESGGAGGEEGSIARPETPASGNANENELDVRTEATGKKDGVEGEGEGEEPNIQDLLLAQPQARSHTISGVEAWEMELGETVKRISSNSSSGGAVGGDNISSISVVGGSKTRTRPRKREMIMGEIGRKSGRRSGVEGGRKRITELFEVPDQAGAEGGSVDHHEGLKAGSVSSHDSSSFSSTSASTSLLEAERESSLDIRESSIAERESVIAERESTLDVRESSITERETTITARESAITADTSEIQQRMIDVQKRELEVDKREQEVAEREIKVERREEEVREWYERKLVEIQERDLLKVPVDGDLLLDPTSTAKTTVKPYKWPTSPIEFARRLCASFLLPVLGEERTPGFLLGSSRVDDECASSSDNNASTSTTTTSTSTSIPAASSTIPPLTTTTTTPPPPTPTPRFIPSWSVRRDFFLKRVLASTGAGSYLVLMGIGICMVFLKGVVRRILRIGGVGRR